MIDGARVQGSPKPVPFRLKAAALSRTLLMAFPLSKVLVIAIETADIWRKLTLQVFPKTSFK
jgi:hypothetical protein